MLRRSVSAYTLRDELLLKDGAPALSIQEALLLAGRIVRFTIVVELIGALLLAVWFAAVAGLRPRDAAGTDSFTRLPRSATPVSTLPAGSSRSDPRRATSGSIWC